MSIRQRKSKTSGRAPSPSPDSEQPSPDSDNDNDSHGSAANNHLHSPRQTLLSGLSHDSDTRDAAIFALWLESSELSDGSMPTPMPTLTPLPKPKPSTRTPTPQRPCPHPRQRERPHTTKHLFLSFRILLLAWRPLWDLLAGIDKPRLALYVSLRFLCGLLPALEVWSAVKGADVLYGALQQGGAYTGVVVKTVTIGYATSYISDMITSAVSGHEKAIQSQVDHMMTRLYLRTELALPIDGASDPTVVALMRDATTMIGSITLGKGSPFRRFRDFAVALEHAVQISAQICLLLWQFVRIIILRPLPGPGGVTAGENDAKVMRPIVTALSNALVIAIVVAPPIIAVANFRLDIASWLGLEDKPVRPLEQSQRTLGTGEASEREAETLLRPDHRQEIILFGLQDRILDGLGFANQPTSLDIRKSARNFAREQILGGIRCRIQQFEFLLSHRNFFRIGAADNVAKERKTGSYANDALYTLKFVPHTLSLGTIVFYRRTAEDVVRKVAKLHRVFLDAYQTVFQIAAFLVVVSLYDRPRLLRPAEWRDAPIVDYESARLAEGGMAIRAVDLCYTYPGHDKPSVRGINIDIKAGETIALVGANGSGKTTLVKVLMGLYSPASAPADAGAGGRGGGLCINGRNFYAYDRATIHRRTSCLFQDFVQYALSLRHNVGLGCVENIGNDEEICRAIEEGEAAEVLEKLGLDGQVNSGPKGGRFYHGPRTVGSPLGLVVGQGRALARALALAIVRNAAIAVTSRRWMPSALRDLIQTKSKTAALRNRTTAVQSAGEPESEGPPLPTRSAQDQDVVLATRLVDASEHPPEVVDDISRIKPIPSASANEAIMPTHATVASGEDASAKDTTGSSAPVGSPTMTRAIDATHEPVVQAEDDFSGVESVTDAPGKPARETLPEKELKTKTKTQAETKINTRTSAPASSAERHDRATGLSGGQWQRVALSRAFMRADRADLVVFDEPSSALDPKAEAELFARIHTLSTTGAHEPTTIYTTHRFNTVRRADRIAFVEAGTIVELGTHDELIALDGRYAEYYNLQKAGF